MALNLNSPYDMQAVRRWAPQMVRELTDNLSWKPFIGGVNNLIAEKQELAQGPGDRIIVGLTYKNVGQGVVGDVSIMDKLQNISYSNDELYINQVQYGFQAPNRECIVQKRVSFDYLEQTRLNMLQQQDDNCTIGLMNQLAGYTASTIFIDGREEQIVSSNSDYRGMNIVTPPTAGRFFGINGKETEADLTPTDTMRIAVLDSLLARAQLSNPVFGRIKGLRHGVSYIWFIHPLHEKQIRQDVGENAWTEITKYAYMGKGDDMDNPIYGNMIGVYRDTILVRSRYCPMGVNADGTPNPNVRRSMFCGANAAMYAKGAMTRNGDEVDIYLDSTIDGGNRTAIIGKRTYGTKKTTFNRDGTFADTPSLRPDHAVMVVSSYASEETPDSNDVLTPFTVDSSSYAEGTKAVAAFNAHKAAIDKQAEQARANQKKANAATPKMENLAAE